MVLSYFFTVMLILSVLVAVKTGNTASLSGGITSGAADAVTLSLAMAGPLCLWSGLAEVMEKCGIQSALARFFRPLLGRLFPDASKDQKTMGYLCGNFTANLLGLGNAATPMGIRAVRRMQTLSCSKEATDEMCRLIVLNTASIQLIPTTVAALRAGLGAIRPFDILPAVWLTSFCSAGVGVAAALLFARFHHA